MTIPRLLELAVVQEMIVTKPPDAPGKLIASGNTVWDLTEPKSSASQSLAIWQSTEPMPPHRCLSDMWYDCIAGQGQLFIEPAYGSLEPVSYYFGEDGLFRAGDAMMIPAGRWCFTIPGRTFTARILNQPAFEPHHYLAMDRANTHDLEVFGYFESICTQLDWPQLTATP